MNQKWIKKELGVKAALLRYLSIWFDQGVCNSQESHDEMEASFVWRRHPHITIWVESSTFHPISMVETWVPLHLDCQWYTVYSHPLHTHRPRKESPNYKLCSILEKKKLTQQVLFLGNPKWTVGGDREEFPTSYSLNMSIGHLLHHLKDS